MRRRPGGRCARQPRGLRLLRQQADDDGGGGNARRRRARMRRRSPAASATRAGRRDMKFMDHERLGFNYRLTRRPGGDRDRATRAARSAARGPSPAVAAAYSERLAAIGARRARGRGSRRAACCRSATAAASGAAGSSTSLRLPARADRDARHRRARPARHRRAPLPPLHPPLRASTGSGSAPRRGSSRSPRTSRGVSVALPFYPGLGEDVDRARRRRARRDPRSQARPDRPFIH